MIRSVGFEAFFADEAVDEGAGGLVDGGAGAGVAEPSREFPNRIVTGDPRAANGRQEVGFHGLPLVITDVAGEDRENAVFVFQDTPPDGGEENV